MVCHFHKRRGFHCSDVKEPWRTVSFFVQVAEVGVAVEQTAWKVPGENREFVQGVLHPLHVMEMDRCSSPAGSADKWVPCLGLQVFFHIDAGLGEHVLDPTPL